MIISIFDIPPIRHQIDEYLTLSDLAKCALVSKEWNAWLNRKLWSKIDFESEFRIEGLVRNQHNVRSIYNLQPSQSLFPHKFLTFNQKRAVESIQFNHLLHLHIVCQDMKLEDYDRLTLLVQQNPYLKSIELYEPRYSSRGFSLPLDRAIPAIQSCSQLDSLTLTLNGHIPPDDIHRHEQLLNIKASIQQMNECKIRKLSINTMGSDLAPFISIPLLKHCPKLEQLTISTLNAEKSLPLLTELFQAGAFLSLTQLDISIDGAHDLNLECLVHSLGRGSNNGCANFKSIENFACIPGINSSRYYNYSGHVSSRNIESDVLSLGINDCSDSSSSSSSSNNNNNINNTTNNNTNSSKYQSRLGLKKLIFSKNHYIGLPVIDAIIRGHHHSLTELCIATYGTSIFLFHLLVDNLPNLKSITMSLSLNPTYDDQFITQEVLEYTWNWSNLTKLDLSFASMSNLTNGNTDELQERPTKGPGTLADISLPQRMGFIFSQIGRLVKLEELGLGCYSSILLLKEGHLEMLSGLKNLWSLDLSGYHGRISIDEGQWMIRHWPKLDRVILYSREGGLLPIAYLKNEKHREFMKVLRSLKPSIQIRIGNSIMSPSGSIPLISSDYIINSTF